jgi:hypothetical protein
MSLRTMFPRSAEHLTRRQVQASYAIASGTLVGVLRVLIGW